MLDNVLDLPTTTCSSAYSSDINTGVGNKPDPDFAANANTPIGDLDAPMYCRPLDLAHMYSTQSFGPLFSPNQRALRAETRLLPSNTSYY